MTNAVILLDQLQEAGVKVTIDRSDLILVPSDRVPPELVPALRRHKAEIMDRLDRKHYQRRFAGPGPGEDELNELERHVRASGTCLTWCEELDDYVAFCRDDVDSSAVPPGFVIYHESELEHVVGLSTEGLRRVHAAKRTGAIVKNSEKPNAGHVP